VIQHHPIVVEISTPYKELYSFVCSPSISLHNISKKSASSSIGSLEEMEMACGTIKLGKVLQEQV